uniref:PLASMODESMATA CALLOSE-BINDING PROTEIN 2 n=1 Tax=Gongylonema pulchrum TaxID=637853 RepID=A0A183E2G3_9BILA
LDSNLIDNELEMRQKMKRTTITVRSYPPVTEPTLLSTLNIFTPPNAEFEITLPLTTPVQPFTTDYPVTPPASHIGFGPRTTVPYPNFNLPGLLMLSQNQQQLDFHSPKNSDFLQLAKFPTPVPPPVLPTLAPVAVPLLPAAPETSFTDFTSQLQNPGMEAAPSGAHFRRSGRTGGGAIGAATEHAQESLDDMLGCAWDIVTNSCKDLFSLRLCSQCHDFGHIFLHNCRCIAKFSVVI